MTTRCSAALLESALNGQLLADDERLLNEHLEQCPECSATLEQLAGGPAWCHEAASMLKADDLDTEIPTPDKWSEIDFTVEHLEPADEPNMLGRLGGYDVLQIIGHGGMGVVLKAFDRDLKRAVAIKVLAPHLAQSALAKQRFAREAQASAAIVHPNVLAIHQVQAGGRLPFLVMPLVAGESLAERLTAQGTLELKEILRIGMQAAAGLAAAHEQGLVHRDVKPANILLEKGVERAVLTDFGLARAADDVALTRWGIIAGTPQYMSPEQARGEPLEGRSDLFSLGCVLYEMATGVSPFRADSMLATMRRLVDDPPQAMEAINPELPPWFIAIVNRLLEKEPARRFSSAAEVSQLLEGCLAHLQQPAHVPLPDGLPAELPPPTTKRTIFSRKTFRRIGVLLGLVLLAIGAIGAFMFATADPPDVAGQWTNDEWGAVELKQNGAGEYLGTYRVAGKEPGKIEVNWSRIERQFTGTWNEGKNRFGNISIRLADDEIRGAWTTDRKSKINPATPALADLHWVRPTSNAAAQNDAGKSHAPDKDSTTVNWIFGPAKNLMMFTTSSKLSSDALRLSDGHLFSLPKPTADKNGSSSAPTKDKREKWLAETGANFAIDYHQPADQWELKLRNVRFAQLPDDDWQSLTAKQLQSQFSTLKWNAPENRDAKQKEAGFYSLNFSRGITPPMTFAFETDDGEQGLIQFVATNITSTGVNAIIRLKLLHQKEASNNESNTDAATTAARDRAAKHNEKLSFGPVIERTINGISGANNVLKLETGDLLAAPGNFGGNSRLVSEWVKANGADIVAYPGGRMAISIVGGLATPGHWDTTAQEVADSIRNIEEKLKSQNDTNSDFSKTGSGMWVEPSDWNTFYIKSRNGATGVLQLKKSSEGPRSTTIRYKLVKDASRSDQVSNGPDNPNGKPMFGPVLESTLNDISIGSSNSALNLATGERLSPDAREFENAMTWAKANGADLIACSDGGGRGLRMIGGLAVEPADWNASPLEATEAVANMENGIEKYKREIPGFQDPRTMGFSNLWFKGTEESSTYYIKTKNGTVGVLQINRLKDYPRSVEFRYKLLQTATPKDEKPDGTGGIHTDVGQEKSIADVVRQFNTRAEWDQIGKVQPPLTEDELRGAIYSLTHSENDRFSTDEKQELEKAAASGVLPKDWQLEVFTKIGGALGERFQGWMIYLSKHRADSKQGFVVRQQLLCQLDEDGKLAPLPDTRKLNQSDDGATPLAAAINGFNSAHHTVLNVRQKPLTEEEVVAAIRWWKTRRNDAPVPNGEFAQFQKIADTRALPQGAEFEVIPDFIYSDGTEHFIWSVRIKMPQQSKPGWTFAYEIRRQYVHSEGIEDVQRKEQTIAWGVAASNGLQAGVRLEPHSEAYAAGEQVTPIFYYRNVGKATLQTSFPNLMTHSYYNKLIAVDTAEKPFTIDQDPNPTGPVGWIEEPLAPGAQHEIKGFPIVLGDVDRGNAETVLRAPAGDTVHLRFELPNLVEKDAPPLPTGEVMFSTK